MTSSKKFDAPIISVSGLTKSFRPRRNYPSSVKDILIKIPKRGVPAESEKVVTVLKDIDFKIFQGEFVGIMGRNGAGKSTLLKILAGIYEPTTGTVTIHGPVAPLIELGAGFNPDLSGYENIFLNAAILGFSHKATRQALSRIHEFSELGDHLFSPVRNYSSGMVVRLGFSIITHLEAPVLLIDEVLAVGDVGFQKKCIDKILELHLRGRTIVLITHDPSAVRLYCSRCIVIEGEKKVFDGAADSGSKVYQEIFA